MTIFLLPTTKQNAVPSAAESKALSDARQHLVAGRIEPARRTLFSVFSPAVAEAHYEQMQHRLAPKAPVISAPRPQSQQPSLLHSVAKVGLVAGCAFVILNALVNR